MVFISQKRAVTNTSFQLLQVIRDVFSFLQPEGRKHFGWMTCCGIGVAVIDAVSVALVALMVSVLYDPSIVLQNKIGIMLSTVFPVLHTLENRDIIMVVGFFAALSIAIKNSGRAFFEYKVVGFTASVDRLVGKHLLGRFLNMPYVWHVKQNSSDLLLAISWRSYFGSAMLASLINLFVDCAFIVFVLTSLLAVAPIISLFVLLFVTGCGYFVYSKTRVALDHEAVLGQEYKMKISQISLKTVQGIKDVMVFAKGKACIKEYDEYALLQGLMLARQRLFTNMPMQVLETVGFAMLVLVMGGLLFVFPVTKGHVIGVVALLAVTAWRVLPVVSRLLVSISTLRSSLPYLVKIFQYLGMQKDNPLLESACSAPLSWERDIVFDKVDFCYEKGRPKALDAIEFTIPKGGIVGVVGQSGAGKSTLVDLLVGLLEPDAGDILIDGKKLSEIDLDSWRYLFGYVAQHPYIVDASLGENIAFGRVDSAIDRERLQACSHMAAIDFLNDLPNGFDTRIGERGVRLSGGQRQRVSIARALYHKPELLIFDEATSALDEATELAIRETIYALKGKMTLLLVAHRVSTLEGCDSIIWLDKGRIRMIGTPEEVLPLLPHSSLAVNNGDA